MITGNNGTDTGNVKVLFIGQCLQYGYQNVTRSSTFSSRTAAMLRARFPGLRFKFDHKFLYHPTGLKAILKHRMLLSPPDVLIINLPAMYAARPWRVNLVYETAPELVDTARSFMQKIEAKVKGSSQPQASTILDGLFAIRQPLSLNEYENTVEEALRECQRASSCSIILIGPGRFNVDVGVTRAFRVGGERQIQFRMEAFNVLNRVHLNNPVSALNNGNFGLITSAGDPRIIQLALKYTF